MQPVIISTLRTRYIASKSFAVQTIYRSNEWQ